MRTIAGFALVLGVTLWMASPAAVQTSGGAQATNEGQGNQSAGFNRGDPPPISAELEGLFWQSIMNSTNPAEFQAYLSRFPNGMFRALAEARLAALQAPDGKVQAVLGVGGTWRFDDAADFGVKNDHLLVVNDSRQRYTLTPGLLFRLNWRIDAMVAANFEGKTDNAFDGVMLGVGVRVHEKLSIGAGYVIRLGEELSPGFHSSAGAVVDKMLADPENAAKYERFRGILRDTCSALECQKAYDGFSLLDPESLGQRIFAGDPIIPSINKSLFVGVFIPLDLPALLQ